MNFRYFFEIGNGLWAIVATYLTVFLAYHLAVTGAQRRILARGVYNLPLSVQLAIGTWIASFGVLITRLVVALARYQNDGYLPLGPTEAGFFSFGIFVGLVGFLCILRVVTRPMLGQWPWVSCLICCSFYLLWAFERLG